jgi:hypothetical protein
MEKERSIRFDTKAKDYKDIQEILKKMIKVEENIIQTRTNFKKKWLEIANIETNQDLSRGLTSYSKALEGIERSHRDNLLTLKTNVLESLRKCPERIKDQRRSLSAHGKLAKDYEEKEANLKKIIEKQDQRKVNLMERKLSADKLEEARTIMMSSQQGLEKELKDFNNLHDEEVKNSLMLLTHSKISYHASAIQLYTEAFKEILTINI